MSDSVPLRWFVYELRGLVMRLESASAASPEFLDGDFAESIRDQALELCESRVQFDELSPDEIRRLEPAETARSAKRILRRMLKSDKPFSVTFDDDARALRKCLNKLPPVDAPSGGKPGEENDARHSSDFASVYWFGSPYTFTTNQAACVKVLWDAWANKVATMSGPEILDQANISQERFDKVFRVKDASRNTKSHPAWKTMIVSPMKGRYCLKPVSPKSPL